MDARSKTYLMGVLERLTDFLVYGFCFFFVASVVIGIAFNRPHTGQGNISAAKAQIKQFGTALTAYKMKFGDLPDSLDQLVKPLGGKPIMNAKAIPVDPWGTPFLYLRLDTKAYLILSLGANGAPGGEGVDADIKSDEITNEAAQ